MQNNAVIFMVVFGLALVAIGGPLLLWNVLVKKMVRPTPSDEVMALIKAGERLDAIVLYMKETGAPKDAAIEVLQKAEQALSR